MEAEEFKVLSDNELKNSFVGSAYSMYLKEVFSYPLLSASENKELGYLVQQGDESARLKIINGNLRLVISVASKYSGITKHMQVLDIIQEGNMGLIRATQDYNPDEGAFSTYAFNWIRQAILRAINSKEAEIRKPDHMVQLIHKYKIILEDDSSVSDEEMCKLLEISASTLGTLKEALKTNTSSMNQKIKEDEDSELGDFLASDDNQYDVVISEMVDHDLMIMLKDVLPKTDYYVLYYRVLRPNPLSLTAISEHFGTSRERIRQIETRALKKSKSLMSGDKRKVDVMSKIRQREGVMLNHLEVEPCSTNAITKYLYIKDELTLRERKIMQLLTFNKYNLTLEEMADYLKLSKDDFEISYNSLKEKIAKKFKNKDKYISYHKSVLKNYGTKIFDIDLTSDLNIVDYDSLKDKYSSLSYDEIVLLFNDAGKVLEEHEKILLRRYFSLVPERVDGYSKEEIQIDINMTVFGFRDIVPLVPKNKLYKIFLERIDEYTEEQRLFLECYFFNKKDRSLFKTKYKDSSLYYRYFYLIDRLEKLYYNIFRYFDRNFNKEDYLKFKVDFPDRLDQRRIEVLDLYYGVNDRSWSISEIAEKYGMDYIKMHDYISDAKNAAIMIHIGRSNRLDIDKNVYIPYITDYAYEFIPETREILSLYLIDEWTYDELSEEFGLSKYKISNLITEAIRKIDHYRFGVSEAFKITKEELEEFFIYYSSSFLEEEREVLRHKFLYYMENSIIADEFGIPLNNVNRYVRHFNVLYYNYRIRNVTLDREEIIGEIEKHHTDSVLDEREKKVASLYYGFLNKYNPDGKRYSSEDIKEMFEFSKNVLYNIFQNIQNKIKGRKIGILKPINSYIERDKLDKILDDVRLPISQKERDIICYLFELKGYQYKNIEELACIFGDTKGSIVRRYKRAIISIYKYLNNEIDPKISYEEDILPIMKYFSLSDRNIINKIYLEGYTVEQLAKEYNVTFETMILHFRRVHSNIFDYLNKPNVKKFDFDYYLEVRNKIDLPFFGDKEKAIEIFDMFYGMNGDLRMSIPEIIDKLKLEFGNNVINRAANNLMLSVCKYRDGIRRNNPYNYEDVLDYYNRHQHEMSFLHKQFYVRYFKKKEKQSTVNALSPGMSYRIINDLLKEKSDKYISLDKLNRESVIALIKKYKTLKNHTKQDLMYLFDIPEREFMNGKELNHIYRLFYSLDLLLLERGKRLKKD